MSLGFSLSLPSEFLNLSLFSCVPVSLPLSLPDSISPSFSLFLLPGLFLSSFLPFPLPAPLLPLSLCFSPAPSPYAWLSFWFYIMVLNCLRGRESVRVHVCTCACGGTQEQKQGNKFIPRGNLATSGDSLDRHNTCVLGCYRHLVSRDQGYC